MNKDVQLANVYLNKQGLDLSMVGFLGGVLSWRSRRLAYSQKVCCWFSIIRVCGIRKLIGAFAGDVRNKF
jgi:hypothetical protein